MHTDTFPLLTCTPCTIEPSTCVDDEWDMRVLRPYRRSEVPVQRLQQANVILRISFRWPVTKIVTPVYAQNVITIQTLQQANVRVLSKEESVCVTLSLLIYPVFQLFHEKTQSKFCKPSVSVATWENIHFHPVVLETRSAAHTKVFFRSSQNSPTGTTLKSELNNYLKLAARIHPQLLRH